MHHLGLKPLHMQLMRGLCIGNALLAFLQLRVMLQSHGFNFPFCEAREMLDNFVSKFLPLSRLGLNTS